MDNSHFITALKDIYSKDPCKVLPNALWKSIDRLNNIECSISQTNDKRISIQGWNKTGLHIYWNEDRMLDIEETKKIMQSEFAIIHHDYFEKINRDLFKVVKPYFRIKHDCKDIGKYCLDDRFAIENVNTDDELKDVSELIGKCYKDLHPSVETVRQWTECSVFDKNLWIWIVDMRIDAPVALGVADLDNSVPEGSLEWIQVLQDYRGNGFGKVLVLELLSRMRGMVDFVTVSGEVNNITNPEGLYRSCGFYGNDFWWLLRK